MNQTRDHKNGKCRATKSDGAPCSAAAQERKTWCYFHDPDQAEKRRAAQARGGQGNHAPLLPIDAPDFAPETVSDLRPIYVSTINQVRRGEISPNAATSICNLANSLGKTFEDRDLRQRLQDLQQQLHDLQQQLFESNRRTGLYDPDKEQQE